MASVELPANMQPTPTPSLVTSATPAAAPAQGQVMVCVGRSFSAPGDAESYERLLPLLEAIAARGNGSPVLLAYPLDPALPQEKLKHDRIRAVVYTPPADSGTLWLQTAADFRMARDLMDEHQCTCCLMLGADAESIEPAMLLTMTEAILSGQADLALPCYETSADEALLNSALIYPLSRSVFGPVVKMPLPVEIAMSARLCERMGDLAAKVPANAQSSTLMWPVAEAAAAGFAIAEVRGARRPELPVTDADLKSVLALVAGSLFSEIESRAQFWQRTRPAPTVHHLGKAAQLPDSPIDHSEAEQLIDAFRLGYTNLHEIWALVLPPNSLLGLKKLSLMPPEHFRITDALWVRVVYDFLLAHRLRTINRGHLLGALTPLYLAWVATYVLECTSAEDANRRVESLAQAFEADKPYLVSRWRWPDRFNP